MREEIRERLRAMSEKEYAGFAASLLPVQEGQSLLGVRLPGLRSYARELAKGDWRAELSFSQDEYFEETMLRGMLLGYACEDVRELFRYLEDFIPRVTNWSLCDSVCSGLKLLERYPDETWDWMQPYLYSGEEFPTRVALILLLDHFVKLGEDGKRISRRKTVTMADLDGCDEKGAYTERIFHALDRAFPEGYYAQMAAAWLLAELFVTYPAETARKLENLQLDPFTRRKAVQKIRESRIPDDAVKVHLRNRLILV